VEVGRRGIIAFAVVWWSAMPLCRFDRSGPRTTGDDHRSSPGEQASKPMNYRLEILTINCVIIMAYMTSA